MKKISTIVFLVFVLIGCSTSESAIQTAIAETEAANRIPTNTQILTDTLQPTDIPSDTLPPTSTQTPSQVPTNTSPPTSTPTPPIVLPIIPEAACVPIDTKQEIGQVVRVIDGDTIEVQIEGENYRVRYIGVDMPEMDQADGEEARDGNSELVAAKQVTLVKDVSETDRYDRLLRYVFVEDTFVNYELVKLGLATAVAYDPDVACRDTFENAERQAPKPTLELTSPPRGNCDPSYPTVCIPPKPPDLDCGDITYRRFQVLPPDPHGFDGDNDGIGCESG